jgi:hypothetical protein
MASRSLNWLATGERRHVRSPMEVYWKYESRPLFFPHFWDDKHSYNPGTNGKVDMSKWDMNARPGGKWVNFDYGWYEDGGWYHANHSEPGMEIFFSNMKEWQKSYADFNQEVFCVACQSSDHQWDA